MKRFQEQVAIVTGGGSGLGHAVTRRLIDEGAFVAVFDWNAGRVDEVGRELGDDGAFHLLDVSDEEQVRDRVDTLAAERGRIDVLINCAGVTGQTNLKSHEVTVDDFDHVFRVNVRGSFVVSKCVIPHMLARQYGRILHIASIAGKEGNAGMLAYSASKAAIIGMTKVQGKDYAGTGITVNALAPAVIETPMVTALPQEQFDYMTARIPMGRCGTLEEFASLAAFIVSPEPSFTSGFTFDLTGGRSVY